PVMQRSIWVAGSIVALLSSACSPAEGPATRTVPGPETPKLLQEIAGYLITDPHGDDEVTGLGNLKTSSLRRPAHHLKSDDRWRVHSVSGPDRKGRVALIDNDM